MNKKIKLSLSRGLFNKKYLPLLDCDARYLVLYGGAGSGKSVFTVQRFLLRLLSEKGRNLLVIRAVSNTNRDSTFAAFKQTISSWGLYELFRVNESDMRIRAANGNSVIFKGLDDSEKLKSITFENGILTDIWVEEASEISQADFNQLDIRLRGNGPKKQIVVTFNPTDINHWLKKRFVDPFDPNIAVVHGTYLDNEFLDNDYKTLLESYKDSDPYYYAVYCLGQWGVFGESVFNAERVNARLALLAPPEKRGYFTFIYNGAEISDPRFVEDEKGFIAVYEKPRTGERYVIGADTAGDGSDSFVAQVVSASEGRQVAVLRRGFDEDVFARQVWCLGKAYNNAIIAIETNFSTYPTKELERLGYANQFIRIAEDEFTHRPTRSYGFKTTAVTRPVIIAGLIEVVRDGLGLISDKTTLEEMLTFVRNRKGRPEARQGAHDDCVIALAIAYYVRAQTVTEISFDLSKMSHWTQDMLEDYENGNDVEKREMERLWGSGAPQTFRR